MKILYLLFFVFTLVLGFVLAVLNSSPININYYYGWVELPLSFALLAAMFIGVLLGMTVKLWRNLSLRRRCHQLSKEVTVAKKEVKNLRVSPVKNLN